MKKLSTNPLVIYLICILLFLNCNKNNNEIPRPTIDFISPLQGYIGDVVQLKGKNFDSKIKISFNQTESQFVMQSGAINTVVPPNATIGKNLVTVTNEGGVSNPVDFIVVEDLRPHDPLPPELTKSYPVENYIDYPVLLYGQNLSSSKVTFNGIEAEIFTNNQNVVTVLVPKGLPVGNVKIIIKTLKGDSNTLDFRVKGLPPPGTLINTFQIVTTPPPAFVPTISNNWSCGLFSDNQDGTFVDSNSEDSVGNYTRTGRYEFEYDEDNNYNFSNFIEIIDSVEKDTLAGQFSYNSEDPCILEMVFISTSTGEVFECIFDRRANGFDDCENEE